MKLILFTLLLALTNLSYAQNFWPSGFPENINKFIYKETHFKCIHSDYIDGILDEEVIKESSGNTYVATYSVYGDPDNGIISVFETTDGKLKVIDLECPSI